MLKEDVLTEVIARLTARLPVPEEKEQDPSQQSQINNHRAIGMGIIGHRHVFVDDTENDRPVTVSEYIDNCIVRISITVTNVSISIIKILRKSNDFNGRKPKQVSHVAKYDKNNQSFKYKNIQNTEFFRPALINIAVLIKMGHIVDVKPNIFKTAMMKWRKTGSGLPSTNPCAEILQGHMAMSGISLAGTMTGRFYSHKSNISGVPKK